MPVVVHHPDRKDVRRRGGAGVLVLAAGGDPGDERAVTLSVALGVRRQRAEVDLRVRAAVEVLLGRVEPGVDDRDRRRVRCRIGLAAPQPRVARDVGPQLRVELERAGLDRRVRGDDQAGDLGQPCEPLGLELDRDAVDEREPLRDLAAVGAAVLGERRHGLVDAAGGLDDHAHPLASVRLCLLEESRRDVRALLGAGNRDERGLGRVTAAGRGGKRNAEREDDGQNDGDAAPRTEAALAAAISRSP